MRNYWYTDELALTYRGDGAEQLRSRRGTIAFIHPLARPNANWVSFGSIKFTTNPDQSGADGPCALEDFATKQEWHGFSYDTLDQYGIDRAEITCSATLSADATIDDYLEAMSKQQDSAKTPKVQAQLVRMQKARVFNQSLLNSIGPVPKAPQWRIAAPIWSLMLAMFFAQLLLWLGSWMLKHRRRVHGLCASCGYNLTANVSGTCPECGTGIATK